MSALAPWSVAGSYFTACSCHAVCPCRRVGERPGGRSTYGRCDFALSWLVETGRAGPDVDLCGLEVVLVGTYSDDEPGSPWTVVLYVPDAAAPEQQDALTNIFLGRAGGGTLENFARAIGTVEAVRSATIVLDHSAGAQSVRVLGAVEVSVRSEVRSSAPVSCGIPGPDRPGQEYVAELLTVDAGPLSWRVEGRCAFASTFAYSCDPVGS